MREKLSVVLITKNEERFIEKSVKSALFADEIIVLDSGSEDKTCLIAEKLGARVLNQEWLGFGEQKNKAIELAENDWVFVLDADEEITEELKNEILEILIRPSSNAFYVGRLNKFFGKNIKYCGLYPDYSIRLFNKNFGKFNSVRVHESFQTKTQVKKMKNCMRHDAFKTVREFRNKQLTYARLSHKKNNFVKAVLSPLWTFIKIYFFHLGFLEGWRGIVISLVYAEYTFHKYSKSKVE